MVKPKKLSMLYWWWKVRHYEQDPGKVKTFFDWLNINDMHLARWELRGDAFEDHDHVLVPLSMEETEVVLERYLRNIRKIHGEL